MIIENALCSNYSIRTVNAILTKLYSDRFDFILQNISFQIKHEY